MRVPSLRSTNRFISEGGRTIETMIKTQCSPASPLAMAGSLVSLPDVTSALYFTVHLSAPVCSTVVSAVSILRFHVLQGISGVPHRHISNSSRLHQVCVLVPYPASSSCRGSLIGSPLTMPPRPLHPRRSHQPKTSEYSKSQHRKQNCLPLNRR